MMQATIFDAITEAERARDDAVAQAEANAEPGWKAAAWLAVRAVAEEGREFTTDVVWQRLALEGVETHEPRALGAVMRRAAKAGLIRATSRWVLSERPECHRRPVRVWAGVGR